MTQVISPTISRLSTRFLHRHSVELINSEVQTYADLAGNQLAALGGVSVVDLGCAWFLFVMKALVVNEEDV